MVVRWFECRGGSAHIIAPCPDCSVSQGGLLIGTLPASYRGRITTKCADCGKAVDYYADSYEEKIWKLEPVEVR